MAGLFDGVVGQLRDAGLIVEEGTRVDATIIEAPRGKATDAPGNVLGHTGQKAATSTKKHGRVYHGYKAHIATDGRAVGDPHGSLKGQFFLTRSMNGVYCTREHMNT